MGAPSAGAVVLVRFPFSDLSRAKLRPAAVLAKAGRGDWLLCQITSNPYADTRSVEIAEQDFASGNLMRTSYARPGKLFSANTSLMQRVAGALTQQKLTTVVDAVVALLRPKT